MMTLSAPDLFEGEAARAKLAGLAEALKADTLVPYLGSGVAALDGPPGVPVAPEEVAAALNARTPAPARIRTNMWSVAQFIEQRKHRKTLRGYMAEMFAPKVTPNRLHRFLAGLPLSLVVDTWYDGTLAALMRAAGRADFVEIQGVTRAGETRDIWTKAYDAAGAEILPEAAEAAPTVVYAPHGASRPAGNFLIADSDYVEVLTEIDIQSPIPDAVKQRRTTRGFLFLGCRFHDQMLRTYARQILKRSSGARYAVIDAAQATRNELKFLADHGVLALDLPLADAVDSLIA